MFVRRQAGRNWFVRIFVGQLLEREVAVIGDVLRTHHRFRIPEEQPRHFLRRLQMSLGIRLQRQPRLIDAAAEADAGHHVLQRPPVR
jgi:hypothetical protein